MSTILRMLAKGLAYFLATCVLVFLLLLVLKRPHTPSVRDSQGKKPPNAVAILKKFRIGGLDQWVSIRGHDTSLPLLLFLHGGPGMPMMYLAHVFQRPLEEDFLCVQWDQRGAGKSFSSSVPVEGMTIRQLLDDTQELVETLKTFFGKKKIFLAGHSFGTYLGMLAIKETPEIYYAFIGIGQVVDDREARDLQERFIRKEAEELREPRAVADLDRLGPAAHEKWLFAFRGELFGSRSYLPFIKAGIRSPEYGLFDIGKVARGSAFSSRHMKFNVIKGSLYDEIRRIEVPAYFLMGRHDQVTPLILVEKYCEVLEAPHKQIVVFEQSAHFPFFEEPDRFSAVLRAIKSEFVD